MDIAVGNWVYYDTMNPYYPDYTKGIVEEIDSDGVATVQWVDGYRAEYHLWVLIKI